MANFKNKTKQNKTKTSPNNEAVLLEKGDFKAKLDIEPCCGCENWKHFLADC